MLPAVLVLGALVGGLGYTKVTVDDADRTVPTVLWADDNDAKPGKDPAGDVGRGRADTELNRLLLPVSEHYRLGPDIGEYGNDAELSGKEAVAVMKAAGRGLTGKQRRERDKYVEKLRLKGIAMRSYTYGTHVRVAEMSIAQMENKKAVRDMYTFQTRLFDAVGVFRKGPSVKGFKNAACYLMPADSETDLDAMHCIAYEGELLVTMEVYGSEPFSKSEAVDLLRRQLDHIESPGEYV
ncbi:hypothetical protein H1V43_30470 [Streptomyces sp. PSKA54]|uniref:Secreted protein n=1 Tax=Streptomyces himalayensis subsp. aureolus TaxID=2758039 RepID=A0A7W2HJ86_9ACTN|nr:hypothetical protein [Streptomyces himalayensis]MBA4865589.1 hypothetical protein [Streptomyces himalayensis subsp. aureolus]